MYGHVCEWTSLIVVHEGYQSIITQNVMAQFDMSTLQQNMWVGIQHTPAGSGNQFHTRQTHRCVEDVVFTGRLRTPRPPMKLAWVSPLSENIVKLLLELVWITIYHYIYTYIYIQRLLKNITMQHGLVERFLLVMCYREKDIWNTFIIFKTTWAHLGQC